MFLLSWHNLFPGKGHLLAEFKSHDLIFLTSIAISGCQLRTNISVGNVSQRSKEANSGHELYLAEDFPASEVVGINHDDAINWVDMVKMVDEVTLSKVDGDLAWIKNKVQLLAIMLS